MRATATYLRDSTDPARLTRVSFSGDQGAVFEDNIGGYNQEDQITGRTITRSDANNDGTLASAQAIASTYTYSAAEGDALTNVAVTVNGTASTGYSYALDGIGNFTGNSTLGTANNVNQYSGYTFDGRGNVTSTPSYNLTWDAQNRPITIAPRTLVAGSLQVRLGYDSQNRWLWKDVYTWDGSTWNFSYTVRAVWDGSNLVAELNGSNVIQVGYTWGPGGFLLAVTDYTATGGPKTYVVARDLSGNIGALIDPTNGMPVASYRYDPYGNLLSATGPMRNLCSFLGKGLYVHAEIPGLMFAANRITDGFSWLSRDPSGESSDDNLYQLYNGDPINQSDMSGLSSRPQDLRPETQVWNEAKADVASTTGLGPNTPWNQVVNKGLVFDTTYGDLVTKSYKAKVDWYYNSSLIVVEADGKYDQDVADYYAGHQVSISADDRSPDEIAQAESLYQLKRDVANGSANPQALQAAQIALRHDNLVTAFLDAGYQVAPDLAAGWAGLKNPGTRFAGSPQMLGRTVPAPEPGEGSLYDVGLAKDLRANPVPFTEVHHVGQSAQAETLLGDFNTVNKVGNEPAIRISDSEHAAINADQVNYPTPVSARGLLARDIRLLHNNTAAPNVTLKELIDLNLKTHPSDFAPLHRSNP